MAAVPAWRAMAVLAMQLQGHPLSDPHGFEVTAKEALKLIEEVRDETPEN